MPGYGRRKGNGPGIGGPAKGAGKGGKAKAFTEDSSTRALASESNDDAETQAYRQARRKRIRELREFAEANQVRVINEARKQAGEARKLADTIMALSLVSSATDRLMSKLPPERFEDGDNADDPVRITGGLPD